VERACLRDTPDWKLPRRAGGSRRPHHVGYRAICHQHQHGAFKRACEYRHFESFSFNVEVNT
jgi:hypothetical protein